MVISPKPELDGVELCPHGAVDQAELGALGAGAVLDFSVNCHPLGAPQAVAVALASVDLSRYPDRRCTALRRHLCDRLGVSLEQIIVGNGSVELIWLLALAYLRPGDDVVVLGPTFGEYARAARIQGARVTEHSAAEAQGFRLDLDEAAELIRARRPRLVFLCNPNNPTGLYLEPEAVACLLGAGDQGLLVVDEAYLSLSGLSHVGRSPRGNCLLDWLDEGVVLLRSMTKDYGLAGLRLGYALANPEVIAALERVQPPWSVNSVAQAAGLVALADEDHLAKGRQVVAEAKAYLVDELSRLAIAVVPSAANFILVRVGNATAFRASLLARGCCVRDCTSFGLPHFVRVGMRPLAECRRLVGAIQEVIVDS
ncbi:MAG: pyridoxal phosphate-dependent aminotransferase [Chloroflexota bacterium]